jgi:hypothetical protein
VNAQRIKTWIQWVGYPPALICAAMSMYVDLASDGKDLASANLWLRGAFGLLFLTMVASWLVGKYVGGSSKDSS